MKMRDFESGRQLRDVSLELTRPEAEELAAYLGRLLDRPDLRQVQISDVERGLLSSELTVLLDEPYYVA